MNLEDSHRVEDGRLAQTEINPIGWVTEKGAAQLGGTVSSPEFAVYVGRRRVPSYAGLAENEIIVSFHTPNEKEKALAKRDELSPGIKLTIDARPATMEKILDLLKRGSLNPKHKGYIPHALAEGDMGNSIGYGVESPHKNLKRVVVTSLESTLEALTRLNGMINSDREGSLRDKQNSVMPTTIARDLGKLLAKLPEDEPALAEAGRHINLEWSEKNWVTIAARTEEQRRSSSPSRS